MDYQQLPNIPDLGHGPIRFFVFTIFIKEGRPVGGFTLISTNLLIWTFMGHLDKQPVLFQNRK